jgi:hypothetical protein
MQLLDFGGIPLPDRMAAYAVPRRIEVSRMRIAGGGSYALDASWDVQEYSADGLYYESSVGWIRDTVLDQLRGCMGLPYTLRGQVADGSIRCCDAYLTEINPVHDNESSAANIQRVSLRFSASPFWYDDGLTVIEPVAATTMLAVNGGNAVSRHIKFVISPTANVANLALTAGGTELTYDAALLTTDVLVIDALTGAVTKNGVNTYGNTTRPDTQMALFELATGENEIEVTHPVTGRVEYRGCWV